MRFGERGDAVARVQQALIDLGFPMPVSTGSGTRPPDGIYGQETTRTVRRFQTQHGLQADGVAGRNTLHTLDALFADHTLPKAFEHALVRVAFSCTTLRNKGVAEG